MQTESGVLACKDCTPALWAVLLDPNFRHNHGLFVITQPSTQGFLMGFLKCLFSSSFLEESYLFSS